MCVQTRTPRPLIHTDTSMLTLQSHSVESYLHSLRDNVEKAQASISRGHMTTVQSDLTTVLKHMASFCSLEN